MARPDPRTVRVSDELNALLTAISTNYSAAVRVAVLLGLRELGVDLSTVADDVRTAFATKLPSDVERAVRELYDEVILGAPRAPASSPTTTAAATVEDTPPDATPPADPFAGVGFDFDD